EFVEPSPALLSHQHPLGACGHCQGFGFEAVIDYERVVPDLNASLATQGVACWNFGKHVSVYSQAKKEADKRGLDPKTPFADYSDDDWGWLKKGSGRFIGVEGY